MANSGLDLSTDLYLAIMDTAIDFMNNNSSIPSTNKMVLLNKFYTGLATTDMVVYDSDEDIVHPFKGITTGDGVVIRDVKDLMDMNHEYSDSMGVAYDKYYIEGGRYTYSVLPDIKEYTYPYYKIYSDHMETMLAFIISTIIKGVESLFDLYHICMNSRSDIISKGEETNFFEYCSLGSLFCTTCFKRITRNMIIHPIHSNDSLRLSSQITIDWNNSTDMNGVYIREFYPVIQNLSLVPFNPDTI